MTERILITTIPLRSGEGNLSLYRGITSDQSSQMVRYAHSDEAVQKFTSDPVRFKDSKAFTIWLQKGRAIYTLVSSDDELAGVIWFGPKAMPKKHFIKEFDPALYAVTFSIRIYGTWRGKGLARTFTSQAFNHYCQSEEYQKLVHKRMWLETSADNDAAVQAYRRFGFEQVTSPDEHNKILMTLDQYAQK